MPKANENGATENAFSLASLTSMKLPALLLFALTWLALCPSATASPPAVFDPMSYLVQSLCPDASFAGLKSCADAAPQTATTPMVWRRHDWPAPIGYQIEDSFIGASGAPQTIWSYPPFGAFNAKNGDGGEIYAISANGDATISETQDGGRPGVMQHFVGSRCAGTGWLIFKSNPPLGAWASAIAILSDSEDANACPPLGQAYTRWRLETVLIPFVVSNSAQKIAVSTIISEHYDHGLIATSQHMERTFFGKGWGRLIWEAWGQARPKVDLTARCPGTAWSTPPAPGWQIEDCRYSTNIVAANTPMTGQGFGWPAGPPKPVSHKIP